MAASPADARAAVAGCLADALDRRGVPDELLQVLQEKEAASLGRCPAGSKGFVATEDGAARHRILFYAHSFLLSLKAPQGCWFEVARLLDTACPPWPGMVALEPEALLARAAALCAVAESLDGQSASCAAPKARFAALAALASRSSECLGGGPVALADIAREQGALLPGLSSAPSVRGWLSVFAARFDVATHSLFVRKLESCELLAGQLAARLLLTAPASVHRPTRGIAEGCFALGLVLAQILPPSALRPDAVAEAAWGQTLARMGVHGRSSDSEEQVLPLGAVLAALELATQRGASCIRAQTLAATAAV